MSRSKEEEYCKAQFDDFLKRFFPSCEIEWEDVENDPPDYYIFIDKTRYAVEVTSLVEKIQLGGQSPLEIVGVFKHLTDFVRSVESAAKTEGSLHGQYVVSFTPIGNFADYCCEIKQELLLYIRETKNLEVVPYKQVFRKVILPHVQSCWIGKIGCQRDKVYESLSGLPKSEDDIRTDLVSLLSERLNKKTQLLKKTPEPKILLLLDAYVHSDQKDYKNCINQISAISALESFHTVFVIEDGEHSFLLYSKNTNWAANRFSITPAR